MGETITPTAALHTLPLTKKGNVECLWGRWVLGNDQTGYHREREIRPNTIAF